MSKIDYIIDVVRSLKEEGAPTMSVGSGEDSLGFNVGKETPPVNKKRIYLGKGSRKPWMRKTPQM